MPLFYACRFQAKHAESLKVDALLCLPELYMKPKTSDELINYLSIVGKAAPNTPLFYYHVPMFSNVNSKKIILYFTRNISKPEI